MSIILLVVGVASGIVAGMGMGGGTLLIPILTIFFSFIQQEAQGINLLVFLPGAIVSLIIHCKNKLVNFAVGVPIIIVGVIASVGGSMLAMKIESKILKTLFGIFLLIIGGFQIVMIIRQIIQNKKKKNDNKYKVVISSNIDKWLH